MIMKKYIKKMALDFLAILGLALFVYGVYLISVPSAFIVSGVLCFMISWNLIK